MICLRNCSRESDETQKGHMRQSRQGVRLTKVLDKDAMLGVKPSPGVKKKDVYLQVFDSDKKTMSTDQSGPFPIKSRRNNQYIMDHGSSGVRRELH
jgi:hypothetical protein